VGTGASPVRAKRSFAVEARCPTRRAPSHRLGRTMKPKRMKKRMKTTRKYSRHFWIAIMLACLGTVAAVAGEHKLPPPSSPPSQQGPPQSHEARQQSRQPPQHTYTGMVTCSQCGARHPAVSAKTAADCSRTCVRSGAQFALVAGEKTYLLNGDVASLKKLAGQRARIVGAMSGNTITISSATAAI
jgi:hypothetical protein